MAARKEVYRCEHCGIAVEVLHGAGGKLMCCGKPMMLQAENTVDASREKHVPVVEKTDRGFKVKVGAVPHPMEEKHHIEWIEVIADGKLYREFLKPGQPAEAQFEIAASAVTAREYCNLHGFWKA